MMLYTVKHTSFHPELASSPSEVGSKITPTWPWRSRQLLMWAGALVAGEQTLVDTCWLKIKDEESSVKCPNGHLAFYYRQEKKNICRYLMMRPRNPA